MLIGVLALQGNFEAHAKALQKLGVQTCEVRTPADFNRIDGLVLPGGESSTHLKLIQRYELQTSLQAFAQSGKPMLATCAGLILSAKHVSQPEQKSFGFLDIDVERNAFGRQIHSFIATADQSTLPLVFIRAPRITRVGKDVEVLARYQGEPVLVKQNHILGATFHPELTEDTHVQQWAFKILSA